MSDVKDVKKVSFGFSKSTCVQKSLKPIDKDGIQFIDYLESKSIMIKEKNGGGDDQNNVVSSSLGNSIEAKKKISTKKDEEPNVQSNKVEESIAALDNNQENCATETLESIAIKELLEEAQNTPSTNSGESLVVQMTKRKHQVDAEESSLEDYERVPVENFGMALLKGMGWKEGKGIGKKPRVVETVTQVPRPRGVGLGAMITLPVQNEDDPEKPLKVSTQVSIISGSYKKCSGIIKGYQDFGRVMVYIPSKNVTVSVNESAVVVLEKKNPRGKLDIKQSHGSTTNVIDRSRYFRQDCGYHFDKR